MEIEFDGIRRSRHEVIDPVRPLRLVSAALYVVTGLETAAGARRGEPQPVHGLRAVPSVVAPIAVAAHVVHALRPTRRSSTLARLVDGLAMVAGAAGMAASVLAAVDESRRRRGLGTPPGSRAGHLPSLAPFALGLTGALGSILATHERRREAELEHLHAMERRARIVERLVPRLRGKRERFVIRM